MDRQLVKIYFNPRGRDATDGNTLLGLMKKVYGTKLVPVFQPSPSVLKGKEIYPELTMRINGQNLSVRGLDGCINALIENFGEENRVKLYRWRNRI